MSYRTGALRRRLLQADGLRRYLRYLGALFKTLAPVRIAEGLMRRHDRQLQEEGFRILRDHAADHVDELMTAFRQEDIDHGLRCWLLELIGEARSARAFPLLAQQLHSPDESLRSWAVKGLKDLDSDDARQAVSRAVANGEVV